MKQKTIIILLVLLILNTSTVVIKAAILDKLEKDEIIIRYER